MEDEKLIPFKYNDIDLLFVKDEVDSIPHWAPVFITRQPVSGHFIAKADIKGSMALTEYMTKLRDDVLSMRSHNGYKKDVIIDGVMYRGCWPSCLTISDYRTNTSYVTIEYDDRREQGEF